LDDGYGSFTDKPPVQLLGRVIVWDEKNQKQVVLVTDLLDVPAHVIAAIYRRRWQIELFFKWLKTYASFDHLISHHPNGVRFQFYVAVIATLLLHLATGATASTPCSGSVASPVDRRHLNRCRKVCRASSVRKNSNAREKRNPPSEKKPADKSHRQSPAIGCWP
jgi:hypothetical protein